MVLIQEIEGEISFLEVSLVRMSREGVQLGATEKGGLVTEIISGYNLESTTRLTVELDNGKVFDLLERLKEVEKETK